MHFEQSLSAAAFYLYRHAILPWTVCREITLKICEIYVRDAYNDAFSWGRKLSQVEGYTRMQDLNRFLKIVNVLYMKYDLEYEFPLSPSSYEDNDLSQFLVILFIKKEPFYKDCKGNYIFMKPSKQGNEIILDCVLPFSSKIVYKPLTDFDAECCLDFNQYREYSFFYRVPRPDYDIFPFGDFRECLDYYIHRGKHACCNIYSIEFDMGIYDGYTEEHSKALEHHKKKYPNALTTALINNDNQYVLNRVWAFKRYDKTWYQDMMFYYFQNILC